MARPERYDTARLPALGGFVVVAALGWLHLAISHGAGHAAHLAGPELTTGPFEQLLGAFLLWSVMMVAMMLPSELPAAALFGELSRRRRGRVSLDAAFYGAGYVAAWIGYSAVAAIGQVALSRAVLLTPSLRSASIPLSAVILLAAGGFQFTSFKDACLTKCRAPLGFFLAQWRDGRTGALTLGLKHGGYCVGCCWALMAVMFVVGAMNLLWMAVLTLFVLGEKLAPARWRVRELAGAALVVWGGVVAISG